MRANKLLSLLGTAFLFGCAQHRLSMADKAHDRMAYADAACRYEKALAAINDRDAALRAADSYRQLNDQAKAADWFSIAHRMAPLQGAEAVAFVRTLMSLGRIDEAAKLIETELAERPDDALLRELGLAIADREAFFADTTLFTIAP